ncbi:unnamed protein product, partial [Brenthis ino]
MPFVLRARRGGSSQRVGTRDRVLWKLGRRFYIKCSKMALENQSSTDKKEWSDLSQDPTDPLTRNNNNNNNDNCDYAKDYETPSTIILPKATTSTTSNFSTILPSENSSCSTDTEDAFFIEHDQIPTNGLGYNKDQSKLLETSNECIKNNNSNDKYNSYNKLIVSKQTPFDIENVLDSECSQNSTPVLSVDEVAIPESNAPISNENAVENLNPNAQMQRDSRIELILPPKKRPRDPSMFTDNTVKKQKVSNLGQEGRKRINQNLKGKYINPPCKCVYKCYSKIDYNERLDISQKFWELEDKQKQLDFLLSHTDKFKKNSSKNRNVTNNRLFTFKYKLPILSKDIEVTVCKKMFLNTLMINDKLVRIAWDNFENGKEFVQSKRGRRKIHKKVIVKTMVKSVRDHVNSFIPVGSQYLGENINKLYLDGSLNISRMFRLYNEWLDPNKYIRRAKTEKQYRDLVKKNLDLGFYISNNNQYNQTDFLIQNNNSSTVTENKSWNPKDLCNGDERSNAHTYDAPLVPCLTDCKEHFCRDHEQPSIEENQYDTDINLKSFNNYSEYHNHSLTSGDIKCNCLKTVKPPLKDNYLNNLEQLNSEVRSVSTSPLFTSTTITTEAQNVANIPLPPAELQENINQTSNLSLLLRRKLKKSSQKHLIKRYNIILGDSIGRPCTCVHKCSDKLNDNERNKIYQKFRDLGDKQKQFDYIIAFTEKYKKKRCVSRNTISHRNFTFKYKLPTSKGTTVNVCKRMFLNTLVVSDNTVKTAWEKYEEDLKDVTPDTKVHPKNMRTVIKTMVKSVRDHVNSFIPVETHFLGRKSNKLYLDGSLDIPRMFKLYNEWLDPNKYARRVKTQRKYREIVSKNFNLGFYITKKDECDQCQTFRKLSIPSDEQTARHIIHTQNIVTAHNKKNQDKLEASVSNGKIISAIFDIEKLLPCPHGQESIFNNKRKLLCFNLPILDMSSKRPVCYMWDECVAKNGANEVSSCFFDFLNANIEKGVEEFRFWSENDESRNHVIFYVYITVALTSKVNIYHNFHVKDHVQSEVTSVHSVIEKVSSTKHIFTPEEWKVLVKWARTNCQEPYKVIDMTQNDFYDFQSHVNDLEWHKDIEGKTVLWNEVREVFISSDDPSKIKFRYDFNQEYEIIDTRIRSESLEISRAYNKMLPLCDAKYRDLMFLCDSGNIPEKYVRFYKKLPHNSEN